MRVVAAGMVLACGLAAASARSQTGPVADVHPSSVHFGSVMVGYSSPERYVDIVNTGSDVLLVRGLALTGAHPGDFGLALGSCPSRRLPPGGVCRVQVQFVPTAAGSRSAALSIETNAPGTPHQVALTGDGLAPSPVLQLSASSLFFGPVPVGTASVDQTVTLYNAGPLDLHVASIALVGPHAGDFAKTGYCDTATVQSGQWNQCWFTVRFQPQQAGGRSASLVITSDAPGSPHVLALSGTGTAPAVTLSATSLTFPTVVLGLSSGATLDVTNSGQVTLHVSGLTVSGAHPADFPVGSATCTAYPGDVCRFTLPFRPRANGARTATLSVVSDAPGSPHLVTLSGTGILPAATAAPPADDRNFVVGPVTTPGHCVFRSGGPIGFTVPVTRVVSLPGAQDASGRLLAPGVPIGSGALSGTAQLDILAYDGSFAGQPVHEVSLNGTVVGNLSGLSTTWSTTTFNVPVGLLRFRRLALGTTVPVDGLNQVQIAVDKNGTADRDCTAVAWARLRFKALSPVVLVHGNGSNGAFFVRRGFVGALDAAGVVNDSSINLAAPSGGSATIAANAADLDAQLAPLVSRLGVDSIHLVAHSKGGLDARRWLGSFSGFNPGFRVLSLTTLSSPHRGSVLADAAMAVRATGLAVAGLPPSMLTTLPVGGPGVPDLTTSFTAGFNPALPPAADYRMLGADADLDGDGVIENSGAAGDEYLAARGETPALASLFASDPTATDVAMTGVYQFLRNVGRVTVTTTTISFFGIPVATITHPMPVFGGGGLNDFLVTVPSATSAPLPFTPLGFTAGDHASVARGGIATALLPFLVATDTARGDLR
jgi:hypothetical protein